MPLYTRPTKPISSFGLENAGHSRCIPYGEYKYLSTASMANFPRSEEAASDTTAQVLLSMKTLPSSFPLLPTFRPFAVMPRRYHSPSQSSRSHTFLTLSAIAEYFSASPVRPRNCAASTNARSAQWCMNDTIALSPPPRFRQSFQSARSPLQIPVTPTCAAEKSSARFRWSYTVASPSSANGTTSSNSPTSPVSLTYSQIVTTCQSASSEQVCSSPWIIVCRSGACAMVGDLNAGAFCFSGSNQSGSNRCSPYPMLTCP